MLLKDLAKKLDELTCVEMQYGWDNSGLLIGDLDRQIQKILLCLEVTEEVISEAVSLGVQMIISHHPVLFRAKKRFVQGDGLKDPVYALIEHSIAIYTAHTNFDMLEGGLNDYVLNSLGVKDRRTMTDEEGKPIGRIFELQSPQRITEYAEYFKHTLQLPEIRLVMKEDKPITKIGIVTGSGIDVLLEQKNTDVELFLTGDVKYHQAHDVIAKGYAAIDGGHYGTEKFFPAAMMDLLKGKLDGVQLTDSKVDVNPFQYLE